MNRNAKHSTRHWTTCALVLCISLGVTLDSHADVFRLRSCGEGTWAIRGQVVTAEVASVSMRGAVLKTRSGILNLPWENFRIEDADKAGRESGYFRINDSRRSVLGPREIELDIFLVSKRDDKGGTNHVVLTRAVEHMNYAAKHWQGKDPTCSAWRSFPSRNSGNIPEFLDDTTVGIPWEQVIMFRLTNQKGQLEPFEIRTHRHHARQDGEQDYLIRSFSLPRSRAVMLDADVAAPYPEIPKWSMHKPDGWKVEWYERHIQFSRNQRRSFGREWKWKLESEDDGPDARPVPGKVIVTKTYYVKEKERPNKMPGHIP